MSDLRVGLIGTGMMGCEHLRNLIGLDSVAITAVSDPNEEPLRWAAKTLGDRANSVTQFTSHEDLLASGLVDAVLVASPNYTHRSILDDILSTDIPVLVEKPMCTTVEDCISVVKAQESRSAITWVGLEYRYMAPIAGLLQELRSGIIGNMKMMSIREHRFPFLVKVDNWNRFTKNTGGTLVEKCCHFFDLMNLAVGSQPVRVMASGGQDVNHLDEVYNGERSDILDNAYVIVEYANGVRTMLDLSMFAEGGQHEQEITVVGDKGKLEAFIPGNGKIFVGDRTSRAVQEIDVPTDPDIAHMGFHFGASFIECKRFVDAVINNTPPEVTVADGLWSVVIGAAAHKSIDESRPVLVSEYGL
ncbi:MAG: Gfo/Idh/MocA family oxidoreductase [Actinobacteria bacterium]|nr:Gfo/Idh/MocA family oxidoreductase [Actinomycetota bacterium]